MTRGPNQAYTLLCGATTPDGICMKVIFKTTRRRGVPRPVRWGRCVQHERRKNWNHRDAPIVFGE